MRLVTFSDAKGMRIGVHDAQSDTIVDITSASRLPKDMTQFVALGKNGLAARPAHSEVGRASYPRRGRENPRTDPAAGEKHPGRGQELSRPRARISRERRRCKRQGSDPGRADHVHEVAEFGDRLGRAYSRASNDYTNSTDYEGELTVVIGTGGRNISREDAYKHVYGYTIANDVTARTLQYTHRQWFLGKSLDGYCPMGPCIVTADEIEDVTQLRLTTTVNGELRQDAFVSQLIFDIPALIETVSRVMTLEPGDLIATGTCAGVGIGFDPPRYLKPGDVVAVTIEPIGTLSNAVS